MSKSKPMVKISHFSHNHPLIILEDAPSWLSDDQINNSKCYGCDKPLPWAVPRKEKEEEEKVEEDGDVVYGCGSCKTLFLHKSCAELPREIVHSSHEEHSLFLQIPSERIYNVCTLCHKHIFYSPFYTFYQIGVYVYIHFKCAFKDKESVVIIDKDNLTLNHPSHEHHPLTLLPRPSSFKCDASCDFNGKDFSYKCSSCLYWIHRRCALLPNPLEGNASCLDPHPLFLYFGLPPEYNHFSFVCEICEVPLSRRTMPTPWLYGCHLCRYFVHLKCITPEKLRNRDDSEAQFDGNIFVSLPGTDISKELLQSIVLNKTMQSEIRIFSHEHPLILSEEYIFGDDIEDDEEISCDACIQPILSPPYYHCSKCKYFLHLHCSNLPSEYQYRNHNHQLVLGSKTKFYDNFRCCSCYKFSNGFYYYCETEGCNFEIDVLCAALTNTIRHDNHKHLLWPMSMYSHRYNNRLRECKGCGGPPTVNLNFMGCEECRYLLHKKCAMLPKTVKHRFDNHRLTLRYPPHFYHPKPFDCAQCEKEIHPKFWLYHCEECDVSFHTYCISKMGEFGNYKCGQTLEISSHHPHPLRFVRKASVNSPCHRCQVDINKDVAFECEICNFHLCRSCVVNLI